MTVRVGIGFDIHRLGPGTHLTLGGVSVPYARSLIGHSDGDALLHAIIDALLGAAAMGDIGQRFPDTDPRYKGADSRDLLRVTGQLLNENDFRIGNVDANVLAERPRLSPYFESMRDSIAGALGIESGLVQVKARSMEGLGPIGAGDAIAAQAVAIVIRD